MWPRSRKSRAQETLQVGSAAPRTAMSVRNFIAWLGPALMVSIAYMDPGNYGTDIAAGASFKYDLLWAVWLASGMAMLLQYLSGKLGIASGYSLPELIRQSLVRRRYVIPYWLAAEAAAAATDLAEYLGTVIALNILFGVPLLLASVIGALDVIILLAMTGSRFRIVEQYFVLLITVLVIGILYNLTVVKPSLAEIGFHSVVPLAANSAALLIVVGIIGATVMPHALYVHSWLSKNKMAIIAKNDRDAKAQTVSGSIASSTDESSGHQSYTVEQKARVNRLHRTETIAVLAVAGVVNAGILLVAIPFYPNANITINQFVTETGQVFGPMVGVIFVLTLLASGLSASALGTIAGQVIMEGMTGAKVKVWIRRVVTRGINVFPTTLAILLGLPLFNLLVYSQVVLSLMIPLPMIPLVYYTSKKRFMGSLVNKPATIGVALAAVGLIVTFNVFLLYSTV